MEQLYLTGLFLFVLFLLLGMGVWIGLALLGVALVGMELFTSRPAGDAMITTIWTASSSWTLTALPLFIWMGEILFRTRLSSDMFTGLSPWLGRLPGRLLHTNVLGCTVFAAVSGSSAATCATVGKMSIPELRRRGYPEHLIVGTLAGAGTLGLMIPPSLTMIVYGRRGKRIDRQAVHGRRFPGSGFGPSFHRLRRLVVGDAPGRDPGRERGAAALRCQAQTLGNAPARASLLILAVCSARSTRVLLTATEAAAIGVLGALVLAVAQGELTARGFLESLMGVPCAPPP